jgi:hypothetical protein
LIYFRAISLVPAEDVCEVWDDIVASDPIYDDTLAPIVDWFDRYYIGKIFDNP